jgi:hypothetical protein
MSNKTPKQVMFTPSIENGVVVFAESIEDARKQLQAQFQKTLSDENKPKPSDKEEPKTPNNNNNV